MSDLNNNTQEQTTKKSFNLPAYINIPFFLYKNENLDRSSLLLASFLYSLHSAGKRIKVSNDYLCELLSVKKRQLLYDLELLEKNNFILRTGKSQHRLIHWIFIPDSEIVIVEELSRGAIQCTNGVQSNAPMGCNPVHPDNKDNNKDNKNNNIPDSSNTGKNKIISDYKKDERFMRFYNAYPKKEDPRDAYRAFNSIVGNDDELLEQILLDLEQRKKIHTQWKDRQFIKYPAVYLRKGEYEGEIINITEENEKKKEIQRTENELRAKRQEEASIKREQQIKENELNKQKDARAYRDITKSAPHLAALKKSMGMK